jgi:carbon-monoxide dehydrogenase small subunit
MTADALLRRDPNADEAEIRAELAGNLCRCTGYEGIVAAVLAAREDYAEGGGDTPSPSDRIE